MKRIFLILLAAVVCTAGSLYMAPALEGQIVLAAESASGSPAETMQALDILAPEDEETAGAALTRMDFAGLLYRMMQYQQRNTAVFSQVSYFDDLDVYHYGNAYVSYLVERGVVLGAGDRLFYPDREITLAEATTMALRAAGYQSYMTASGRSWDVVAAETDLLSGVVADGLLTQADAAVLLYNLMFTDHLYASAVTAGDTYYAKDGLFLQAVMGLDYCDGVVEGVSGVSLYGASIGSDVLIDGTAYSVGTAYTPDADLLGYHVRAYVTRDDNQLILLMPTRNTQLEIDTEEMVSFENNRYRYETDGKIRTAKMANDMVLLYNGRYADDAAYMVPAYGFVTLIDNDGDGEYEVAKAENFESYVVDTVSAELETIVFKNLDASGNRIIIELNDYEQWYVQSDRGTNISLGSLQAGNILTIQRTGNQLLTVVRSSATISGELKYIEDGAVRMVSIGDVQYKLTDTCYSDSWDFSSFGMVTAYLDTRGRIAAITAEDTGWKFGYILDAKANQNVLYDVLMLRLLTQEGKVETLTSVENVMVDGVKTKSGQVAYGVLAGVYDQFADAVTTGNQYTNERLTTRLVRYCLNADGEIKKLDTPLKLGMFEGDDVAFSDDDALLLRSKGSLFYKSYYRMLRSIFAERADIEGEIMADAETKVFVIPQEGDDKTYQDYRVTDLAGSRMTDGQYYNVSGYTINAGAVATDVIVLSKPAGTANTKHFMIVDNKTKILQDGEPVLALHGYTRGERQTFAVAEQVLPAVAYDDIAHGDVIIYEMSGDKIIVNAIAYNTAGTGLLNTTDCYSATGTHSNVDYRAVRGVVTKMDSSSLQFAFDTLRGEVWSKPGTISFYDVSDDEMFVGNTNDLHTADVYGDQADVVFLSTRNGIILDMVAVRQ